VALKPIFLLVLILGLSAVVEGEEVKSSEVGRSSDKGGVAAPAMEPAVTLKFPYTVQDKRDQAIDDLLQRVELLEKKLRSMGAEPAKVVPLSENPSVVPPPRDEEEAHIAQAALERTIIERSGMLLSPGTLEIEPSLTFAHASADNISINGVSIESTLVIGEIISDKTRRNILLPALAFRLGLPKDFQAEAKFPMRYESKRIVRGDTTENFSEDYGLGDIELALSHQLLREKDWMPDILASVRWKSDTGDSPFSLASDQVALGSGNHALQFSLTALKVKEPAAIFGSLLYTLNFPTSKLEGALDPGDGYGLNLGLALALNLDTSISFTWEQRFFDRTELNGAKIPGSAIYPGSLRIGVTHTFTPRLAMDTSIAIGLTRDAPDVQAVVAFPIRFPDLFFHSGK
jgi:hypothetical protein